MDYGVINNYDGIYTYIYNTAIPYSPPYILVKLATNE